MFVYLFFTTPKTMWYVYSGSLIIQSVTAIQLVSHSELNCMRSSSAATVHAVSRALRARVNLRFNLGYAHH